MITFHLRSLQLLNTSQSQPSTMVLKITRIQSASSPEEIVFIVRKKHYSLQEVMMRFIQAVDRTVYRFTDVLTHARCRGKTRKVCTPRAGCEWLTNFSRVLPTHQVGYYARKPILLLWHKFNFQWVVYWCNERQIFDQWGRSKYFSYFINCRVSHAPLNSWWIYGFHIFTVIY